MSQLQILAPTRYPWHFNGPHFSANAVCRRNFIPVNRIWKQFEAVTVFNPLPPKHFDLVHAFNRIPLGPLPFIIGFESHLPRAYGAENTRYFRMVTRVLSGERCKRIIAISEHARRTFRAQHQENGLLPWLEAKLGVRYPSIDIPKISDHMARKPVEPIIVTFVGNHFGRKGGCVGVRLAQIARERGLPLELHLASNLEVGGNVWTDPTRRGFFDRYLALLDLPNVHFHRSLANSGVQKLLRNSHLSLLTTFSDSFGYSAIESMANWAPVLATRQGALPEFIQHEENGILLDLPVTELGDWIYSGAPRREEQDFEKNYADEIERLAEESFKAVARIINEPGKLADMRRKAREKSIGLFDSRRTSRYWDRLYQLVIEGKEGWPDDKE